MRKQPNLSNSLLLKCKFKQYFSNNVFFFSYNSEANIKVKDYLMEHIEKKFEGSYSPKRIKS